MKLTILGSGTAYPSKDRHMSGYVLEVDGKKLLFDSGPGTVYQLLKAGFDLNDFDHIFYSHFHIDHIGDLPSLIHSYIWGLKREKKLNIYGPKGIKEYFELIKNKLLTLPENCFEIEVNELGEAKIDGINIKTAKMNHDRAIGYRVEKDKSFVYSGDTGYCNEIVELAKDADLLLLECAYPDNMKKEHHLTPKECSEIARKSNAKKIVLTHFYPQTEDVNFKEDFVKAEDLMEVKIE